MYDIKQKNLKTDEIRDNNPSRAWKILFEEYDIVNQVRENGYYDIKTSQMMRNPKIQKRWNEEYSGKNIPDNRNILKFDFSSDLPNVFKEYGLQIMPMTRDTYQIAAFDMYFDLKQPGKDSKVMAKKPHVELVSVDIDKVTTEPVAQMVAENTGMLEQIFLDLNSENEDVVSTLSGKKDVSNVEFSMDDKLTGQPRTVSIDKWQSEIDGVYESNETVLVVESKMKLPRDFNVRQLYVPAVLVKKNMDRLNTQKDIFVSYFVKTDAEYIFTIYRFGDLSNFNSLEYIRQYEFIVDHDQVDKLTPIEILDNAKIDTNYPQYSNGKPVSFPQANNLNILMDYLQMLNDSEVYETEYGESIPSGGSEAFTDAFKYDRRQYNYYADMLGYLGLVDRTLNNGMVISQEGKWVVGDSRVEFLDRLFEQFIKHPGFNYLAKIFLTSEDKNLSPAEKAKLEDTVKFELRDLPDGRQIGESTLKRRISGMISMMKKLISLLEAVEKDG